MIEYEKLLDRFPAEIVFQAIFIACENANEYPESYTDVDRFEPHIWVVAAIAEGLVRGKKG